MEETEIIELNGEQGNVFYLLGKGCELIKEKKLPLKKDQIIAEMTAGTYEDALNVFTKYFGKYCTLV